VIENVKVDINKVR